MRLNNKKCKICNQKIKNKRTNRIKNTKNFINKKNQNKIKFDQHYMIDEKIIQLIIEELNPTKKDTVVEIGPGKGALTKEIIKKTPNLTCIELDKNHEEYLKNLPCKLIFGNAINLINIINSDIIISNLPYSISEPLVKKIIKTNTRKIILTTGIKFYENITNKEKKLHYMIKCFYTLKHIKDIEKESFYPKPKTKSTLFTLSKKEKNTKLNLCLQQFFLQDDKLLKNNIMHIAWDVLKLTKKESKNLIYEINIEPKWLERNSDLIPNKEFIKIKEFLENLISKK